MTSNMITLIGIGATFVIGIFNFFFSVMNNRKTRFINTVTTSRVNWIKDLRNHVSFYVSLIPTNEIDFIGIFEKKDDFLCEFQKAGLTIRLMLNSKDTFDENLIKHLERINEIINDTITCLTLFNFNTLKEYEGLNPRSAHDAKIRLIDKLSEGTKEVYKLKIIEEANDSCLCNEDVRKLIVKTEYENWVIKKDAYLASISNNCLELKSEIDILLSNCAKLLKKEWDRVKLESEVGEQEHENKQWSFSYGLTHLNTILRLTLSFMIIVIVALLIIA